nr:uncharacterized protein K02A2.6-like [Dermacentor andersoni]
MSLKDDARPIALPSRRVPHALKEPLRQELDRMEAEGIITRMQDPTDWVSPLVIVTKKNGRLRVCMDPRRVNEGIRREHYELPRREDIEAELAGARYFSKLDANRGFYQIPLDDYTSCICTFSTAFGRYRFLRLPFGLSSAPEVFQKAMSDALDNLPGMRVYIDDILVWGATREKHDARLKAALRAIETAGSTLNPEKCVVAADKIKFLGDVLSKEGIRPDPHLVRCVASMPSPTCKQEVQRLLGAVNYFGKFLPCLSEKTNMLRSLVRKDSEFEWTEAHDKEWKNFCGMLSSAPLLAIFDTQRPTKVSTDAFNFALGAALLQLHEGGWRPVAYASRVLTQAETRYSQIEKEALGITFGCERFREFIVGSHVTIETDHQPLLAIAKMGLNEMPPRVQRFFLRLMQFDFTLQFVPGKQLLLADALSRLRIPPDSTRAEEYEDVAIHAVNVLSTLVSDAMVKRLQAATAEDEDLRRVMTTLENREAIQRQLSPVAAELSVVNGILVRGAKVIIPKKLRKEMLDRVHEGHLGVNKAKARARALMYWPAMQKDIEEKTSKCETCCRYAYRQPSEPVLMKPVPLSPWSRIGLDLCEHAGVRYLVGYDAHSNYPEVEQLTQTTSHQVIQKLELWFARHGIPLEVCTDGGPQFFSREFLEFAKLCDFRHVVSSPRFPRANGLAEKGVQVFKRLLKKTKHANEALWLGLLNYRSSPLEDGKSPAQLLTGRQLRGRLPDFSTPQATEVKKQTQRHRPRPELPPLRTGDTARLLEDQGWTSRAKVTRQVTPRSYLMETEDGSLLRRNRQHILRTAEPFHSPSDTAGSPHHPQKANGSGQETSPAGTPERPPASGLHYAATPMRRPVRARNPRVRLTYDESFEQEPGPSRGS